MPTNPLDAVFGGQGDALARVLQAGMQPTPSQQTVQYQSRLQELQRPPEGPPNRPGTFTTPVGPSRPSATPTELVNRFTAESTRANRRPLTDDEIALHKRNGQRMIQEGRTLAEVKAYMDAIGMPKKKKADYGPGVTPQYILGGITSALHGATYGWDDEAIGSLYGVITGSGAQAGRDVYRQHLQAFHDANPTTDLGLQLAGGIVGAGKVGAAVKGLKGLQWLQRIPGALRVPIGAGGGGATYAAGDVEGELSERVNAAWSGGLTGAVVGGTLTGAAGMAGTILKPFARKIPGINNLLRSSDEIADDTILLDLTNDGAKIPDMVQRAKTMIARGQRPTIGDLAGENTLGRITGTQALSGPGKHSIKKGLGERQEGQGDRLMDWISGKASNLGLGNIEQVRNGLLGARALHAEDLYDAAYKLDAPLTDRLASLFRNKHFQKAWNESRIVLREQKEMDIGPLSRPFFPAGWASRKPGQAGPVEEMLPPSLSVAGLDFTKRYLDRIVRSGMADGKSGWDKGVAHAIRENLEAALKEVDQLVPEYGAARKMYRGDSHVIDALDEGRDFLRTSADGVQNALLKHGSQAETEAYRIGVMENIRNAIYGQKAASPNPAQTVLGGKEMQRRIRSVFGTDADDFLDRVKTEARFTETFHHAASGSRTTPLAEVLREMEQQAAGVVGFAASGRAALAAVSALRAGGVVLKQEHAKDVAASLARRYTFGLRDPAELVGYLLNLQSRKPRVSHLPRVAAAIGGQSVAAEYYPGVGE